MEKKQQKKTTNKQKKKKNKETMYPIKMKNYIYIKSDHLKMLKKCGKWLIRTYGYSERGYSYIVGTH